MEALGHNETLTSLYFSVKRPSFLLVYFMKGN